MRSQAAKKRVKNSKPAASGPSTLKVVNRFGRGRRAGGRVAWTLAAPLLALATLAGHQTGYRLAIRDPHARADALAHDGHGYFAYVPIATGTFVALAVLAVAWRARGRVGAGLSMRVSAALPPLGFVVQEQLERLVHGQAHGGAVLPYTEPAFLAGLALQLPFALLALLLARKLQYVADTIAGSRRPALRWAAALAVPLPPSLPLPRPRPLADARSVRGPPALAQ
jgi:hypothetical protein